MNIIKKVPLVILVLVFIVLSSFDDENKSGLARVNKRQGIEIYVFSEPLKQYEIIGKVNSKSFSNWATGVSNHDVSLVDQLDVLIKKANKEGLKYDAIITDDGKTGVCIKFK